MSKGTIPTFRWTPHPPSCNARETIGSSQPGRLVLADVRRREPSPLIAGAEPFLAHGDRLGILVLHGVGGSPVSGDVLGAASGTRRAHRGRPRLPGHGTRWQDLNRTRWQDWYEGGRPQLRMADPTRSDTVVVMGLSNGATLGLRLAERHLDLAGLVLVNPQVHTERLDTRLLPGVRYLVPGVPAAVNDIKKPGVDEGAYDRTPLHAATRPSRCGRA